MNKLPIVDLHPCIQGEGKNMGIPHILIRFTGCNLNCDFGDSICDTPYASWNPEKGSFTMNDIIFMFKNNPQINHVFFTGGEPGLHIDVIEEIIYEVNKLGNTYHYAIETNGTIDLSPLGLLLDLIVVSPKLTNSIPEIGKRVKNEYMDEVIDERRKEKQIKIRKTGYEKNLPRTLISFSDYILKFVINDKRDLDEVKAFMARLKTPKQRIWLMPAGISNNQLQKTRAWLVDECIKEGFNYSDRLHIVAFGNKRIS